MKVKLICGRVGNGFAQEPGQVIEVPEEEGHRMLEVAIAEPVAQHAVEQAGMVETATVTSKRSGKRP